MSPTKTVSSSSLVNSNSTSTSTPLFERSPNTASPSKTKSSTSSKTITTMDDKPVPRFDHTAQKYTVTAALGQSQSQSQTYISPSDAMQSPTTKKLSEIKGRRFM
ncbi:hypothetical protein A1O3_08150 [Capronia epimyces CBS 606.96]|uniref:Uncharacterized protein n=1 Tax=Capronia epimyces CBS 606.96 TaxID=1182542 RepID=W9XRC2_9EURO|nr:uncharacterized protein A1O3_08150 [Capronia epimyces CBS 606.96]EXJ79865.1 hypothetical protein A1O3_08150 [Capronia epimyces CBS 606.96]